MKMEILKLFSAILASLSKLEVTYIKIFSRTKLISIKMNDALLIYSFNIVSRNDKLTTAKIIASTDVKPGS